MPQTVPSQHPAVVLRSHYRHLRALLAIALVAVVGLTVAVVSLATDDNATSPRSASPVSAPPETADGPRYIHSPASATTTAGVRALTAPASGLSQLVGQAGGDPYECSRAEETTEPVDPGHHLEQRPHAEAGHEGEAADVVDSAMGHSGESPARERDE